MLQGASFLPPVMTIEEKMIVLEKAASISKLLGRLDEKINTSLLNDQLLNIFSFQESVQSTRIEGTQVTFQEIMEVKDIKNKTQQQQEVYNYKKALDYGVDQIKQGHSISTRLLKELHKILMSGGRGVTSNGGEFRKIQNFIGPDKNIDNASYIPVSANDINRYMENLEFYINSQYHSSFGHIQDDITAVKHDALPLLRLAVAHAQFESIHPFLDGNGRLGRILIVLVAFQEKIVSTPIFFVSEELEAEKIRYYNTLNLTRGKEPNWFEWIMFFLKASERFAETNIEKIEEAEILFKKGLQQCSSEAEKYIWAITIKEPIVTAKDIESLSNYNIKTVRKALNSLSNKRLIEKDKQQKRNVKYYNYDILRIMSS